MTPSHLKPDWKRFELSESLKASINPDKTWLVIYEEPNDKIVAVLRGSEVDKLVEFWK